VEVRFPGPLLLLVLFTRAPRGWPSPNYYVSTFATRGVVAPSRGKMKQREGATREGVDGETRRLDRSHRDYRD
jgi:hypothetical protein